MSLLYLRSILTYIGPAKPRNRTTGISSILNSTLINKTIWCATRRITCPLHTFTACHHTTSIERCLLIHSQCRRLCRSIHIGRSRHWIADSPTDSSRSSQTFQSLDSSSCVQNRICIRHDCVSILSSQVDDGSIMVHACSICSCRDFSVSTTLFCFRSYLNANEDKICNCHNILVYMDSILAKIGQLFS